MSKDCAVFKWKFVLGILEAEGRLQEEESFELFYVRRGQI